MKFEEIFNQKGLYSSNDFVDGYGFEVDETGTLSAVQYQKNGTTYEKTYHHRALVYKGLFQKEYFKVLTFKQLFDKQ